MDELKRVSEPQRLQTLIDALNDLDNEARVRLIETVTRFFDLRNVAIPPNDRSSTSAPPSSPHPQYSPFSQSVSISVKDFIFDKNPQTYVERVVCLAFYLTHYRDMPLFRTIDISKLNTEAAQSKFPNAAYAVNDATKCHFLVPASRGTKQISALGEQFVQALPDRDAAKAIILRMRRRRTRGVPKRRQKSGDKKEQ